MGLTAYDTLLLRRAAALGVVLATIVFLIMLGTDDGASTHATRLGRLAALSSLAGAGGAFLAVAQARSRGELRALRATGTSPFRSALGGVLGGVLVGLCGVALAWAPGVDLTPLFPRALSPEGTWTQDGATWIDAVHGVRVAADGAVKWAGGRADVRTATTETPFVPTMAALVLAAIALPLWATVDGGAVRRGVVCFAIASAVVLVFHLVAAQRTSSMVLVLPPLAVLADALLLQRGRAWS
jgi:hypothetical protein